MDEQTQQEFIEWLTEQLKVESPNELETKLKDMGEEGIKKAYEMFSQMKTQQNTKVAMAKSGSKLDYLTSLKKGGKTVDWKKTNAMEENKLPHVKNKPTGSTTISLKIKK